MVEVSQEIREILDQLGYKGPLIRHEVEEFSVEWDYFEKFYRSVKSNGFVPIRPKDGSVREKDQGQYDSMFTYLRENKVIDESGDRIEDFRVFDERLILENLLIGGTSKSYDRDDFRPLGGINPCNHGGYSTGGINPCTCGY